MPVSLGLFSSGSPQHVVFVAKFKRLDSVIKAPNTRFGVFGTGVECIRKEIESRKRGTYTCCGVARSSHMSRQSLCFKLLSIPINKLFS